MAKWMHICLFGHHNESEQIVTPVRSQTIFVDDYRMQFSTAPKSCVSGQGFLLEQWPVCRPVHHTKHCRCFLGHPIYILI